MYRTFLSKSFFLYFAIWQFTLIAAIVLNQSGMLFATVVLAGIGLVLVYRDFSDCWKDIKGNIELNAPTILELGVPCSISLSISNLTGKGRTGKVVLEAPVLRQLSIASRMLPMHIKNRHLLTQLTVTPVQLGVAAIDKVTIRIWSPMKLWVRQLTIEDSPQKLRVVPVIKEPPSWYLSQLTRGSSLSLNPTSLLARGHSPDQIHSIRDWRFPDPIRYIDQKKTAKYGRLMTRTFDSFETKHLIILLDSGRALCGHIGSSRKIDFYLALVLWLSRYAISQGDRVSFITFSSEIKYQIVEATEMRSFSPLYDGTLSLEADSAESDYLNITQRIGRISQGRSIVLLLTDLIRPSIQSSIERSLSMLARQHLTLAAGLLEKRHSLNDLLMQPFPENYTAEQALAHTYAYWLSEQSEVFQQRMSLLGVRALCISESYWMTALVKLYSLARSSQMA
jgi:uncharacterized protein (DUF58 family)